MADFVVLFKCQLDFISSGEPLLSLWPSSHSHSIFFCRTLVIYNWMWLLIYEPCPSLEHSHMSRGSDVDFIIDRVQLSAWHLMSIDTQSVFELMPAVGRVGCTAPYLHLLIGSYAFLCFWFCFVFVLGRKKEGRSHSYSCLIMDLSKVQMIRVLGLWSIYFRGRKAMKS